MSAAAYADVKAGVEAWTRGDYASAVEQWRALAAAGDADAQYNLGQAYKLGRGVSLDLREAEKLLRLASLQGHPQAEDSYGFLLYEDGRRPEAVTWLERSAARGDLVSELILGTMLFEGDAVAPDHRRAYALVSLAHQEGLTAAAPVLLQLDQQISDSDREAGTKLAKSIRAAQLAMVIPERAARVVVTGDNESTAARKPAVSNSSAVSDVRNGRIHAPALPASTHSAPSSNNPGAHAGRTRSPRYRALLGAFRVSNNANSQRHRLQRQIVGSIASIKSRGLFAFGLKRRNSSQIGAFSRNVN
jgi:tetratricopeptide (TPR) repeat protein